MDSIMRSLFTSVKPFICLFCDKILKYRSKVKPLQDFEGVWLLKCLLPRF